MSALYASAKTIRRSVLLAFDPGPDAPHQPVKRRRRPADDRQRVGRFAHPSSPGSRPRRCSDNFASRCAISSLAAAAVISAALLKP